MSDYNLSATATNEWYDIGKRHSKNAKYPLIKIKIQFNKNDGSHATFEANARGWDTRRIDGGWKLAAATGGSQAVYSRSPS